MSRRDTIYAVSVAQGSSSPSASSSTPTDSGSSGSGSGSAIASAPSVSNGSTVCGFGDSLIGLSSTDTIWGPTFFNVLNVLSNGKMQFVHNGGVSGNITAQMLTRLQADALSQPAAKVIIDGGSNDIGSIALGTIQANLAAMYQAIRNNGQLPILCTIPPHDGGLYAETSTLNAWIRKESALMNVPLIDLFAASADPLTGNYKAGYSLDGIHPYSAGLRAMAQQALTDVASVFPGHHTLLPYTNADPNNLIANGLMLVSAGGIANGWATIEPSGHVTYTVAADSTMVGNAQIATKTTSATSDNDGISLTLTTGFSAGDKLAFVGKIATSGIEAGLGTVAPVLAVFFYTLAFSFSGQFVSPYLDWTCDVPSGQFYLEFRVPPNTTYITIQLNIGNGKGVIKFGQMGMYNLTALGLA